MVAQGRPTGPKIFPADVEAALKPTEPSFLLERREPYELEVLHIPGGSMGPGIQEAAASWDYEATLPALAGACHRGVVVSCRHPAAHGFAGVRPMKTGEPGCDEDAVPFEDGDGEAVPEEMGGVLNTGF